MRRLLTIAASMFVGLLFLVVGAVVLLGAQPLRKGSSGYEAREALLRPWAPSHPGWPLVAWLGDSTIAGDMGQPPYSSVLSDRFRATTPFESYNRSQRGFDQYVHYAEVGRVLALEPDVIVLVVNFALLTPAGAGVGILQLASLIPSYELPRSILLPWHARSITVPRLLLARAMDNRWIASAVYFLEGTRKMFREALHIEGHALTLLTLLNPEDRQWSLASYQRMFDRPMSARSPAVRMLQATVDMAVRQGVPTLVTVAPVPVERLSALRKYGPHVHERVAVLREVVESAGGRLLDLHDALADREFRDKSGHYNPAGAQHMVDLVGPVVMELLSDDRR